MSDPENTENQERKESEKIFSSAVKFFKQGDFEISRQEFEKVLKSTEKGKGGLLSGLFKGPSLHEKAENYVKKIINLQIRAEEKKKKEISRGKKETPLEKSVEKKEERKTKAEEEKKKKEQKKSDEKLAKEEAKRRSEQEKKAKKQKETELKQIKPSFSFRITKKIKAMTRHPLVVGIDVSDHSIEVLQLDVDGNILFCARSVLEKGTVESAEIKDAEKLGKIFQETLKMAGLDVLMAKKRARIKGLFSLPESKVFIREFVFETRDGLQEKLREKIKETIPLSFEDLYWDHIELGDQLKGARLLVVAVPAEIIDQYLRFFWSQKVDPVVFEIEASSIARALLPKEEQGSGAVVIDIGAKTSIISIFDSKKDLNLSVSVFYAGDYFTKKIAEKLGISQEEAEQMKESFGFEEEPAASILKDCSAVLVKEIQDALKYHRDKFGFQADKIIIAGGSALLPGIEEYLQGNFKEKVEIGRPLRNIKPGSFFQDDKQAMLFANVIGLAMRGIYQDFIDTGLNLLTDDIKNREKISQRERERFFFYVLVYFLVIIIALSVITFTLCRLGLIRLII